MNIPFYKNPGLYCAQACMKMLIDYFEPDNSLDLDRLAELSHKREDGATLSAGIVLAFYNLGYDARLFTKTIGEQNFSKNVQKYYDQLGVSKTLHKKLVEEVKEEDLLKIKKLSIDDIKDSLNKNYGIIVLVDWNKIKNKPGYCGHFVVLTELDKKHAVFHNPGPDNAMKNQKIATEEFVKAMNAEGTDNDIIIVKK